MNANDMQAGRELDAKMAELIGWIIDGDYYINKVTEFSTEKIHRNAWKPSLNIAAALLVVEKMEESLNVINIRSVVPSSDPTVYIVHFGDERRRVTEFTLPLAICLAALKSIGE